MSDIDLTEAVDAALLATIPANKPARTWRRDVAEPAVAAALPHIERQVRERLHRHIRSWPASRMRGVEQDRSQDYYDGVADALCWAAGVVRGEWS